jgi:hypothetical protein
MYSPEALRKRYCAAGPQRATPPPATAEFVAALNEFFDAFRVRGNICGVNEHFGEASAAEILRYMAKLQRKSKVGATPAGEPSLDNYRTYSPDDLRREAANWERYVSAFTNSDGRMLVEALRVYAYVVAEARLLTAGHRTFAQDVELLKLQRALAAASPPSAGGGAVLHEPVSVRGLTLSRETGEALIHFARTVRNALGSGLVGCAADALAVALRADLARGEGA